MKQPEFSQSEPPESTSTQQHKSLQQMRWKRSRKAQTIAWAIIVSVLPALAVGTVTYYLFNQSISKQNTLSKQIDTKAETKLTLQGQLSLLLIETGVTAVLAGTFAAILANRTIRPILNAADSNTVANRPSQEKGFIPDRIFGRDELAGLETNIGLEEQMPNLSWKRESADRFQVLLNIIRQIREAFSEEDVLRIAVEETRRAIGSDRVVIFRFDEAKSVALGVPRKRDVGSSQEGNFIAESAAPSWSKILWTTVHAPSFAREEVEQFHRGYPRAINDIYQAILTVPQIKFLEQLAVKACLVAPIFKNNQLFGLLIAHQCSGPRRWQQPEIDLLTQIAIQIGYALDHVWRLETINVKANYAQVFINVISSIRESISEEDILATTVEEVRKALRTDRVIVYGFDANWHGTVVAESVLPGWPKALWARIKDPCFEEGYIDKYQAGRVQATNNIYEAGLTDCHIGQLEPFGVKANLVAPILKENKLFGLLIAHECSGPRIWQQSEINLFKQLGMQVGFALDHARLLDQVERAYQAAEVALHKERQQKEGLQHQVSELLSGGRAVVEELSTKALGAMESVQVAYNQIQSAVSSAREVAAAIQQAELQTQQASQKLQSGQEVMSRTVAGISVIRKSFVEIAKKVKYLDRTTHKLSEVMSLINNVASQIQLQAISTALEAARTGAAGQESVSVAEINSLVRQLEAEVVKITSIGAEMQTGTHDLTAVIVTGTKQVVAETRLLEASQQGLNQIATVTARISTLIEDLVQAAAVQSQTSISASNSILEVATLVSHTSAQSQSMADSFAKLVAIVQQMQAGIERI